jgi:hypothetical protein
MMGQIRLTNREPLHQCTAEIVDETDHPPAIGSGLMDDEETAEMTATRSEAYAVASVREPEPLSS